MNDAVKTFGLDASKETSPLGSARLDTGKTEIADFSKQIAEAANALGAIAQAEGRRAVERVGVDIEALASGASKRTGAAAGAMTIVAQDSATSIGDAAADMFEERPAAWLALALAAGFLIGVTWRR